MPMTDTYDNRPIAVFDSGVGGISTLSELTTLMPNESYLYFGDSLHAPYGSRTEEEVRAFADEHIGRLIEKGAKAVVIACNTTTGAAVSYLREKYAGIPIIGMEPAIKPAVEAYPGGRVLVMATPVTLASGKFRALMGTYEKNAEVIPLPCPNLAQMVEAGVLEGEALDAYLAELFLPFRDRPADAVVLGCTHYPFVREAIEKAAGKAEIFDGGPGTAREVQHQLEMHGSFTDRTAVGEISIDNSDPTEERLRFSEKLLEVGREKCKARMSESS